MNKDSHLISEAYEIVREQNNNKLSWFNKALYNLGVDQKNLTQDQVNQLIYSQKPRDLSYEGFKTVQDYLNSFKETGVAVRLPARMGSDTRSSEKIMLDYLTRLDGVKPGDPLSYYNKNNPNWMSQAYIDEHHRDGPFSNNWNPKTDPRLRRKDSFYVDPFVDKNVNSVWLKGAQSVDSNTPTPQSNPAQYYNYIQQKPANYQYIKP